MNIARVGNKHLAETEPWKIKDSDPERVEQILQTSYIIITYLSVLSEPFLPFTSNKLMKMIGLNNFSWDMLDNISENIDYTFKIDKILPLIDYGHDEYGENKVQEAIEKWTEIKQTNPKIKLHMVGKLQTNKVKFAVQIFDYIHSVDSEKLAKKISDEQQKQNKKIKLGICGEHGGDPKSIEFCAKTGLDYVSCSPYRVPVARLAAAQAELKK